MLQLPEIFSSLQDPRKAKGVRHGLDIILMIYQFVFLQNLISRRKIQVFMDTNQDLLRQLLGTEHLPSASTVCRTLALLDADLLEQAFNRWAIQFSDPREQHSVDAKVLRGTVKDYHNANLNYVACCTIFSAGYAVRTRHFDFPNGHETKYFRTENQHIKPCLISADAGFSQNETLNACLQNGHDYFVGLKKNRSGLYQQALNQMNGVPLSCVERSFKDRNQKYEIFAADGGKYGDSVRSWVRVTTEWKQKKAEKRSVEVRYYFSNRILNAEDAAHICPEHWKIENQLHWTKDAIYKEDNFKTKNHNLAKVRSLFTTIAINLIRKAGFTSVQKANQMLTNNISLIMEVVKLL